MKKHITFQIMKHILRVKTFSVSNYETNFAL